MEKAKLIADSLVVAAFSAIFTAWLLLSLLKLI
ncbi:MAG: hypothetical protein [Podoviridae sp. ctg2L5]|nr:MAG: hypothetical protein [Podoviridae sp. ctg2L5]